ncbi:MAG: hypothetical protein DCC55_39170 [Chloroflexi bacterium]|nr:MAG: hypothetical protein DCC55_39170 [Chloroflexota bacterium]
MPTIIVIDDSIDLPVKQILKINSANDLLRLQRAINAYLHARGADKPNDRYISSVEARQIARASGYEIPTTTLVNAYKRGNIATARKIAGSNRWESLESAFLQWLDRWAARRRG